MTLDTATDPIVDLLGQDDSDYRGLYYRWEHQQWEAGKIDLSEDRASWAASSRSQARSIAAAVAWRHRKASVATGALVPFVDSAPDEEQQVFLTTQLVDEARHLVFFDRVGVEMLGSEGLDLEGRVPPIRDAGIETLLGRLEEVAAALRTRSRGEDMDTLVEAIVVHHLCLIGVVGQIQHRYLSAHLRTAGGFPGLLQGLDLAARDVDRHVAFGLRFLEESVRREARYISIIERALATGYPMAKKALSTAGDAGIGTSAEKLQASARTALEAWFEAVKLEVAVPG